MLNQGFLILIKTCAVIMILLGSEFSHATFFPIQGGPFRADFKCYSSQFRDGADDNLTECKIFIHYEGYLRESGLPIQAFILDSRSDRGMFEQNLDDNGNGEFFISLNQRLHLNLDRDLQVYFKNFADQYDSNFGQNYTLHLGETVWEGGGIVPKLYQITPSLDLFSDNVLEGVVKESHQTDAVQVTYEYNTKTHKGLLFVQYNGYLQTKRTPTLAVIKLYSSENRFKTLSFRVKLGAKGQAIIPYSDFNESGYALMELYFTSGADYDSRFGQNYFYYLGKRDWTTSSP